MGYCYGQNERGNWVLACDGCGAVGGVRKRTCPHTVLGDSLRTGGGIRPRMNYCPPPAYCGGCYKDRGGLRGVHGDRCREGAASSQREADAVEAGLYAGELFVVSASTIKPGLVEATFWGRYDPATRTRPEAKRRMPEADYDFRAKPHLSDYAYLEA